MLADFGGGLALIVGGSGWVGRISSHFGGGYFCLIFFFFCGGGVLGFAAAAAAAGDPGGDGEQAQGGREERADHTRAAQAARQQEVHQLQQFGEFPLAFYCSLAKCGRISAGLARI